MHVIARSVRVTAAGIALLLAASGCAPLPASGPVPPTPAARRPAPAPPPPLPRGAAPHSELEARTFAAVNAHRSSVGLRPLTEDPRLSEIARAHSRAMADGTTGFGHDGFARRAAQALDELPARRFAENVARSTRPIGKIADGVVRGWLNSAVHRRNIDGGYTASGVGVARDARGATYLTQVFVAD